MLTADEILRIPAISRGLKTEFAWGGNYCRATDTLGAIVSSATAGFSDASYPASNVISGWDVHYNPAVDLDNNWWGSNHVLPNDLIIDLGSVRTINNIQVFLHPFRNTCSSLNIYASQTGIIYALVGSYVGVSQLSVIDCTFTANSVRYIKISPQNLGSDGWARIVQVKSYYWQDETNRTEDDGGNPRIMITAKSDPNQNAVPSPSEATITLSNMDGRFSPFNVSSPIYGITLPDGAGSGVRDFTPVKITASGDDEAGNTFSRQIFYGFIRNQDSPAGTMGISYDNENRTADVVCKSIYSLLNKTISTPVYSGTFFYRIIQDICWRCGIPQQYLLIDKILQMAPYIAFGTGAGMSMLNQIMDVLPFSQAYESFAPISLTIKNYGRTRMDSNFSAFVTNMMDQCYDTSGNVYLLDVILNTAGDPANGYTAKVWTWNLAYPMDDTTYGIRMIFSITYPSTTPYSAPLRIFYYSGKLYLITFRAEVYQYDLGTSTGTYLGFMITPSGLGPFLYNNATITDKFIFYSGYDGANTYLYVWDVTQAFGTKRNLGNIPWNCGVFDGTGQYFIYQYLSNYGAATKLNVYVWNHAGNPYVAAFAPAAMASIESTGGNTWFKQDTGELAYMEANADTFFHPVFYDIPYFIAHGVPSATDYGPTSSCTNTIVAKVCTKGNYAMYTLSDSTMWVYNLSTMATPFKLGEGVVIRPASFNWYQYQPWFTDTTVNNFMMAIPLVIEGTTYDLFIFTPDAAKNGSLTMTGFVFVPVNTYDPAPVIGFSLLDFMVNCQATIGNPKANHIRMISSMNTASPTASGVWERPYTFSLSFPAGRITTHSLPFSGNSLRGWGNSNQTRRTMNFVCITGNADVFDDPSTWTNLVINGFTYPAKFFAFGDMGYALMDLRGNVPALTIDCYEGCNTRVWGRTVGTRQSYLSAEIKDDASVNMYGDFLKEYQTPLLNDPSFIGDFLLQGKYARIYAPSIPLPWYPIIYCSQQVTITDPNTGFSSQFQVVEYTIDGFNTTIKAVQYYPTVYNI